MVVANSGSVWHVLVVDFLVESNTSSSGSSFGGGSSSSGSGTRENRETSKNTHTLEALLVPWGRGAETPSIVAW